jgi:hypothetical protein
LAALSQPSPQALSRTEHDSITHNKLVRKRTQAQQRSDSMAPPPGAGAGPQRRADGKQLMEVIRKSSLAYPVDAQGGAQGRMPGGMPEHGQPPLGNPGVGQGSPRLGHGSTALGQGQGQGQGSPGLGGRPPVGSPGPGGIHSPGPGPGPGVGARPRPGSAGGPGKQFAGSNRYSLTDPGAGGVPAGAGRGRPTSQEGRPGIGRLPSVQGVVAQEELGVSVSVSGGGGPVKRPGSGKGPTTFAEMGIQGAKAEDKECRIM